MIIGLPRARLTRKNLREFEAPNQFAQAARASALAEHELDPRLAGSSMVNHAARDGHRRDSTWRNDIYDQVGTNGGLDATHDEAAAHANLAKFGRQRVGFMTESHTDGKPDGNAGVTAFRRRFAGSHECFQHEIALRGLPGRESDQGSCPNSQARQGRPPRNDNAADEDLVGQTLADDLHDDGSLGRQLGGRRAEKRAVRVIRAVQASEFFCALTADSENIQNLPLSRNSGSAL